MKNLKIIFMTIALLAGCSGSGKINGSATAGSTDETETDTGESSSDTNSSTGSDIGTDTGIETDSGISEETETDTSSDTRHDTGGDTGSSITGEDIDFEIDFDMDTASIAIEPMPLISRNVPAYKSGDDSVDYSATNGDYTNKNLIGYNLSNPGGEANGTGWMAYDLSRVPAEQRGRVLVTLLGERTYLDGARVPSVYNLDAHAGPGGERPPASDDAGWVTLLSVDTPNPLAEKQHFVNLTDGSTTYNWLRIMIYETNNTFNSKISFIMDIHDASMGLEDDWHFVGDSITSNSMGHSVGPDGINFAKCINKILPGYYPAFENDGVSGWLAADQGIKNVPEWIDNYPGHYVGLSYGTNDANWGISTELFYDSYDKLVQSVLNAGKIPVIPTIPWNSSGPKLLAKLIPLNGVLIQLKSDYHPQILDGPDLWRFFKENPQFISDDNLHPSDDGEVEYVKLWARKMLEVVYDGKDNSVNAYDTEKPSGVGTLSAEVLNSGSIKLSWNEASDNTAIEGYIVYRSGEGGVSTDNVLMFTDTGLNPATTYTYSVAAYDMSGNLSDESSIDVTTAP